MTDIKCKVLHFSDLHFGDKAYDSSAYFLDETKDYVNPSYRKDAPKSTIHLLEALHKRKEQYDCICITGDFTVCGNESGFIDIGNRFISRLGKLCRDSHAICCAPGNHDVKWSLSASDTNFLSNKFLHYKNFILKNKLTSSLIPNGDLSDGNLSFDNAHDPLYLNSDKKLAILCINSAIRCGELNKRRQQAILEPAQEAIKSLKTLETSFRNAETTSELEYLKIRDRLNKIEEAASRLSIFDIAHVTQDQLIRLSNRIEEAREEVGNYGWKRYVKIAILHHHLSTFDSQHTEHKAFEMCSDSSEVLRFLCDHQFDIVLTGHKHQPYVTTRTFNNRKILIIGCSTIAGHPTRGEQQGFQSLDINKRDGQLRVTVTKLPIDTTTYTWRYFTDVRSHAKQYDINISDLNANDIPTFQLRGSKRPYKQLIDASEAKIYALTFRTLGDSFKSLSKNTIFKYLRKVELYAPSLMALYDNHPTWSAEDDIIIKKEWKAGLESTLNGFLDKNFFPKLDHIEVIIVSNIPTLTGAIIQSNGSNSESEKTIIYTPVVKNIYPADIPTLIHKKSNKTDTPLFDAYCTLIENAGAPFHPLHFTVKREGRMRLDIEYFIERLTLVCNNPLYEIKDLKFQVEAMHENFDRLDQDTIQPATFSGAIRYQFKHGGLEIIDHETEIITFSFNNYKNKHSRVKIEFDHFVAYFVCLVWKNDLLLVKIEGDWDYDLPGGKRKSSDKTWVDTIVRETFEEIGIILDPYRCKENFLGTIYDSKSTKQKGQPVIASYCYYVLNDEEYYDIVKMQQTATKNYEIIFFPIVDLLEEKEAKNSLENLETRCHAPEFSIRRLCETLQCIT